MSRPLVYPAPGPAPWLRELPDISALIRGSRPRPAYDLAALTRAPLPSNVASRRTCLTPRVPATWASSGRSSPVRTSPPGLSSSPAGTRWCGNPSSVFLLAPRCALSRSAQPAPVSSPSASLWQHQASRRNHAEVITALVREARYDVNLCEPVRKDDSTSESRGPCLRPPQLCQRPLCRIVPNSQREALAPGCLPAAAASLQRARCTPSSLPWPQPPAPCAFPGLCGQVLSPPAPSVVFTARSSQVSPYHTPLHVAVEARAEASLLALLELGGDTQVICVRARW